MRRVMARLALCGWLLLPGCGGEESAAPSAQAAAEARSDALNSPPVIDEVVLEPSRPRPGETVRARVSARDPDGDPVTLEYSWRVSGRDAGSGAGRSSLHVEGAARDAGIELSVVARDAHGESQPAVAYARVGNTPPSIVMVQLSPAGRVSAGTDITATPRATDPEGGEIEFRYHWLVNGKSVPVEGPTLPGTSFARGDSIVLELIASDGDAESEPVLSPAIPVVNAPPRVVSNPGAIGADGIFRYAVQAEDPDGDHSFRYRLIEGPEGMAIGFDDGELRWEPPAGGSGKHPVEIEVEDLFGGKTSHRFVLQVAFEDAEAEAQASAPAEAKPPAAPPAARAAGEGADESERSLFDPSPDSGRSLFDESEDSES